MAIGDTQPIEADVEAPVVEVPDVTTTTHGSRTTVVPAPGEAEQRAKLRAADEALAGAQSDLADPEAERARDLARTQDIAAEQQRADVDELADRQDEYDRQIAQATAAASEAEDAYRGHKFEDYWAKRGTGAKVRATLAAAFTGFGNGLLRIGGNSALDMITRDIDRDFAQQRLERDQLLTHARNKAADVNAIRERHARDMADLQIKQGKAKEAVASEALARMTRAGIPLAEAQNNVVVKKLLAEAEMHQEKALEGLRTHYTSGGSRSVKMNNSAAGGLSELVKMKADGAPPDQIAARAEQLRIPPGGKSGYLAALRAVEQTQEKGEKHAAEWAKSNRVDDIRKEQRELSGVLTELKTAGNNPLLQALAIEKAVSAARGGAASKQALGLALSHLGGSMDNAEALISKWKSGAIGDKQKRNFVEFLNAKLGNAQREGKDAFDAFTQYANEQDPTTKRQLMESRGKLFAGMHGYGAPPSRAEQALGDPEATAPEKKRAATMVLADPNASPDAKKRATSFLAGGR